MKKMTYTTATLLLSGILLFGSCVTTRDNGGNPHRLPPGQAKKIYGTQSAKPFAPGQQKKGY
ncbi:quinol oxidase subunit 4 [Chitinophaga pendula]|uniref:quinol oxidase subunit 4 n=1 Tax=Chitinophaga TaxID=79328 RepID=UPI000BB0411E|nr:MULTISPECIES: quinol oxidase subunit 4 [Chitinophaga]ASZ10605.1 quinol oxidase subunit 4 [Chitinophaga sp. MD30]UCJ06420.1 quinol oxidase subunit 4 [Chitinophaga pendula]